MNCELLIVNCPLLILPFSTFSKLSKKNATPRKEELRFANISIKNPIITLLVQSRRLFRQSVCRTRCWLRL